MDAVITLREAEQAIATLPDSDKAQLLRWLEKEVKSGFAGIEKTAGVMGGAACIRQSRIPVWLLEQARRQGVSEADLLRSYPQLSAQDLANAWDYVNAFKTEIDDAIAANESDDERDGKRLENWVGMDDDKIWIADDFNETPGRIRGSSGSS